MKKVFSKAILMILAVTISTAAQSEQIIDWAKNAPVSVWTYGQRAMKQDIERGLARSDITEGGTVLIGSDGKELIVSVFVFAPKNFSKDACAAAIIGTKSLLGWNHDKGEAIGKTSFLGNYFVLGQVSSVGQPRDAYEQLDSIAFVKAILVNKQKDDIQCVSQLKSKQIQFN